MLVRMLPRIHKTHAGRDSDQHVLGDALEVCPEVTRALHREDLLLGRLDAEMTEDLRSQACMRLAQGFRVSVSQSAT